ncbi:putative membrane protein YphA (DoxX/SURF4 family) [Leifsonia sp. EB41]|uniref:hypothetical protein n=1 Tax=Leifsonia sp. EB41 TaxID=3156260 RepID=UPI003511C4AD
MHDLLRGIVEMFMGCVVVPAGVLLWRHAEGAAKSFRRPGSTLFGDKAADTVYTASNVKWAAGGWVVIGSIMFVSGLVTIIQLH